MKSRSPGFHRSDLPTGNPQSKPDRIISGRARLSTNTGPDNLTGDIGVPDGSPALTRHDAELRPRSVQNSKRPAGCQQMKRPLAGSVSRRP